MVFRYKLILILAITSIVATLHAGFNRSQRILGENLATQEGPHVKEGPKGIKNSGQQGPIGPKGATGAGIGSAGTAVSHMQQEISFYADPMTPNMKVNFEHAHNVFGPDITFTGGRDITINTEGYYLIQAGACSIASDAIFSIAIDDTPTHDLTFLAGSSNVSPCLSFILYLQANQTLSMVDITKKPPGNTILIPQTSSLGSDSITAFITIMKLN